MVLLQDCILLISTTRDIVEVMLLGLQVQECLGALPTSTSITKQAQHNACKVRWLPLLLIANETSQVIKEGCCQGLKCTSWLKWCQVVWM